MDCEKCRSKDLKVLKTETGMRTDFYTEEQYEETAIYFKCNNCGHEFIELV